jgi:hypothetical protein
MRINPTLLLSALLFAAACLGQCPIACYDCGGGDAVCCNGTPVCDCASAGCADPSQVCDDGCCVLPNCPDGEALCDPSGECDYGDCVSGCCVCSQPCDVSNTYGCDSGEYCDAPEGRQQGCCTDCDLPCAPDDDSCWCGDYLPYTGSVYCLCLGSQDGQYGECGDPGDPPWLDDYPAACFPDAPGCPDGVVTCHYGAAQCAGTGKGCDSNGCCTLTGSSCQLPGSFNNGQCPVDWVQVGDCCEAPCNYSCSVDSDCASVGGICVGGCCGCVPGYNFSGGAPTCGPCGQGLLQCDGSCQETDCVCNAGQSCGNCGTMGCGGWCEDPCPYMPGSPCGGCGTSNGFGCEDPCDGCATQYTGQGCGNCGTMRCNGTCDDPCACIENMGDSCGYCGNLQCNGQCNDPCNGCSPQIGQGCGNCGTIDCNGNCDDSCS